MRSWQDPLESSVDAVGFSAVIGVAAVTESATEHLDAHNPEHEVEQKRNHEHIEQRRD
jgi:hypothetical protein